ncbi:MAG: NADH-quinone oxidoreductase subunit H [Firmicutes bacterium]|nr:NADH-quinone oxidoreductase subunit H [Bacillota bacterium]
MAVWTQVVGTATLFAGSPLLWGLTQKVKARLQGRRGSPVWQMYWVIVKNWRKETTVPEHSSWVFRIAPSVSMAALSTGLAMVPAGGAPPSGWPHDLLVVFFLLALERFWVGLAGMDSAGTFGGLGASRVTTLGTGIEPALLAAFGVLWQVSGHTAIAPLAQGLSDVPGGGLPWVMAASSFGLVLLAELGRLPVDNPDTHLELTMIHEATILEASGRLLSLWQWAMTLKLTLLLSLGWAILGPPWGSNPWVNLGLRCGELAATAVVLGWVESRFTKLRYLQLPTYTAVAAGVGVLALFLVAGGFGV